MKKWAALGMGILAGVAMSASAQAEGNAAKGKVTFGTVCASCHGKEGEGNKTLNAPLIAGQDPVYLTRQLKNFRAGIRGAHKDDVNGAQMAPMAKNLPNDQAVEDVVAFIKTLKPKKSAATIKGDAAKGKISFTLCSTCHGPTANGTPAMNAPRLQGQHDWYLARQLKNLKAGVRGAHPQDTIGAQMRPMAMTLATEADINNVVTYIGTLQ